MIKILIYSNNKQNIDKIKNFLSNDNFELYSEKLLGNPPDTLKDVKLIIFDVTDIDLKDKDNIKNITKKINQSDITKIIILKPKQKDFLFYQNINFNDFIFYLQIEKELLVRIKSILYRLKITIPKNTIIIDELVLNMDKYQLTINGNPVELTYKEFELLKILIQNQNKVFTRNNLLSVIWSYNFYGGSRTVDVHIRRLRSKIGSPYNQMLKTIRGVGYIFSPPNLTNI